MLHDQTLYNLRLVYLSIISKSKRSVTSSISRLQVRTAKRSYRIHVSVVFSAFLRCLLLPATPIVTSKESGFVNIIR